MAKQIRKFPEDQYQILIYLFKNREKITISSLSEKLKIDQIFVASSCLALAELGLLGMAECKEEELRLGTRAKELFVEQKPQMPEKRMLKTLFQRGSLSIPQLAKAMGIDKKEVGQNLKFLKGRGWAENKRGVLSALENLEVLDKVLPEETLLALIAEKGTIFTNQIKGDKGAEELIQALNSLKKRKNVIKTSIRTIREVWLLPEGQVVVSGGIQLRREITQLTSDMLLSEEWKDAVFKPYDVTLEAAPVFPGKQHPFSRVMRDTRRIFFEMGFSEIASPHAEVAFWDFDALFQPQDHPAREMQDTFYLSRPARGKLPADQIVEKVAQTHQDGGDTGSRGWGYKWSQEVASKMVLRTHTTAATIRDLAEKPSGPRKVFCIGKVFRRETIDYKHLPVFHQVDGIIVDPRATFTNLLGTLAAFYQKMGFDEVEFRPAFSPTPNLRWRYSYS